MAQKSLRRPTQWIAAMSCRRPSLSGPACAWTPHGFFCGGSLPPWGAAGERSEFNIKPPLGAPLLIFPRGYLLKSFPQVDTSARQRGSEIRVFPLLGELPKAIEPHLPVFQLYCWQISPNMWSSPTTKSLDPIVVTALRVGFPGESHGPATCAFACNCPVPEAWTTEASGQSAAHNSQKDQPISNTLQPERQTNQQHTTTRKTNQSAAHYSQKDQPISSTLQPGRQTNQLHTTARKTN